MKSREQNIPLLLWISTAILAHIATGGGAEQIARVIEDRSELQWFARTIRGRMQPPQSIEVAFEALPQKADEPAEPQVDETVPRPPDTTKHEKKKQQPQKPPEKKAEKTIVLPPMVAAPAQPQEPKQPPPIDHRIA